jgi:sugar phosphate isomerase/epimerase
MFWASGSAERDIASLLAFGLHAGQLGVPGELTLDGIYEDWSAALGQHPDLSLVSAVCSYAGEDYADIPTVQRTVGIVPPAMRAERVDRTKQVADIAAKLQIRSVGCHIGFVPEDRASAEYAAIRDTVRDICDHLARQQQTFALETGQETANALLDFIADVNRPNLKINFDPANMILYGTGDPVEALSILAPHVVSVHCKDGVGPDAGKPGSLGQEQRLGAGQVPFPGFLETLRDSGYRGILSIEREEPDKEQRNADIRHAVAFLRDLKNRSGV